MAFTSCDSGTSFSRRQVTIGLMNFLNDYRAKVYLFGSRATNAAHRSSDIDIAVFPEEELPIGLFSDIREALEQSNILYHVELVDLRTVAAPFRNKVLKEGVQWRD